MSGPYICLLTSMTCKVYSVAQASARTAGCESTYLWRLLSLLLFLRSRTSFELIQI